MKKLLLVAMAATLINHNSIGQVFDDFEDGVFNSGLWNTYLPNYGTAGFSESGGKLHFVNGALVSPKQSVANATIEGRFRISGWNYDRFAVLFRSDGSIDSHWQSPWGGIGVRFTLSDNPDYGPTQTIQIRNFKYDYDESLAVLASSGFSLSANTYYDFKIVDDGFNISVYMNGATTPTLSVSTLLDYGDTIQFGNRSQMHGWPPPYNMDLDYISIVPEPSVFAIICAGGFALAGRRKR